MRRKVVVTGMGVVSPAGIGLEAFARSLKDGVSGEGPILSFDTSQFPVKRAYEVKDFHAHSYGTHLLDPFIQYAIAAADEAIRDAGFDTGSADPYRIGICVSSSKGGVHTIDRFKERLRQCPSAILGARVYCNSVPNFAAQWIARRWKIKGPAKCYVVACATGTTSVIEGVRMIEDGVVDYCVAGASDASIVPLMLAGYYRMKALSLTGLYPFDCRRKGFMVGEGAGIVFLESEESACRRRARIYSEILGSAYGFNSSHPIKFSHEESALAHTLDHLMRQTGLSPNEIGYVNLHGTGTPEGDLYETRQIKRALGAQAYQIPMSSIKSITGHMLGASGAVEIIASILAMRDGFVPPTVNLEKPDPECDLDYCPQKSRPARIETAISQSLGFGGQIAVIALKREKDIRHGVREG